MTEGNAFLHIISFSVPLFIGAALQELYVLSDALIASHFIGDGSLASIGSVSVISSMLFAFATGVNQGYCFYVSRFFGAENIDELKKCTFVMVVLDILLSVVLTFLSLILIKPLLIWLKMPNDIFGMAYRYIVIVLSGLSATVLYNMCAGYLRSLGNSRVPLLFLLLSSIMNIALDLVFVIIFSLGVVGTAIATVISQFLAGSLLLIYIIKVYPDFLPSRGLKIKTKLYLDMMISGLSVGIMSSVYQIGTVVLQRSINALGTSIVTSHTVSRKLFEATNIPSSTLGHATAVFTGQNYGAGKMSRVRKGFQATYILQLIWSVFCILFAYAFARPLVSFFTATDTEEIIYYSVRYFNTCVLFYPVVALVYIFRNSLQALDRKIVPVLSSFIELIGKLLSSMIAVPLFGYTAVIFTEPLIWSAMALFLTISYIVMEKCKVFEKNIYCS